jgi:hypothetical protein
MIGSAGAPGGHLPYDAEKLDRLLRTFQAGEVYVAGFNQESDEEVRVPRGFWFGHSVHDRDGALEARPPGLVLLRPRLVVPRGGIANSVMIPVDQQPGPQPGPPKRAAREIIEAHVAARKSKGLDPSMEEAVPLVQAEHKISQKRVRELYRAVTGRGLDNRGRPKTPRDPTE